jgi:PAS domain S-box-containing protein
VIQVLESEDARLLDQLEAGIVVMDGAGVVVRWNAHAERILGVAATDAVGRPWADILTVERGGNVAGHQVRLIATLPTGWHGPIQLRIRNGRDVWVKAHVQSLKLVPGDEKAGVVAVFWADTAPTTDAAPTVEVDARLMVRLEMGLEQERHLTAQLETLMGLTLLPQGNVSEATVAHLLLERIVNALGADGGCVLRENGNRFRVVAQHEAPPGVAGAFEAHPANAFQFWRTLLARPEGGAFRVPLSQTTVRDQGLDPHNRPVASIAVFPIRESDRFVGAFLCYFSSTDTVSQADERNIEAAGRIISIAYSNVGMSEGLAKAAEHERRLTSELQALQAGAGNNRGGRLGHERIRRRVHPRRSINLQSRPGRLGWQAEPKLGRK